MFGLKRREDIGERISRKVDRLVVAVRRLERPGCECGRCNVRVVQR